VRGPAEDLRAAAHAWADGTARAQGLPVHVERLDVLRSVAVLLGAQARGLGAPDRAEPVGVEAVVAASAGADDNVVEDGLDDLGLFGQR